MHRRDPWAAGEPATRPGNAAARAIVAAETGLDKESLGAKISETALETDGAIIKPAASPRVIISESTASSLSQP